MDNLKKNRVFLWVAIFLLTGNLIMLSLIWFKPAQNIKSNQKELLNQHSNQNNFEHRMANELQLDQKQLAKYHELKKIHMTEIWNLRDSIKQNKWLVHQELMKENPDINRINQLSDSIGLLNAKFEKLNYNHFFELKKQLNEDQLIKFSVLMEQLPYGRINHQNRGKHRNRR